MSDWKRQCAGDVAHDDHRDCLDHTLVYRMVALDLDGTLLQSDHRIADEQAQYLRDLYATGVKICIATGRAAPSVYEHIHKLALPEPIPVVCSNGARGVLMSSAMSASQKMPLQHEVFYTPVSHDVTKKTIELASQLEYCVQYYVDDYIYANPTSEGHFELLQQYTDITQNPILSVTDNFKNLLDSQDDPGNPSNKNNLLPSKLLVRFEKGNFEKAHQAFVDILCPKDGEPLATIIPGFLPATGWFLEILHPDVNKGQGLRRMCETLDISLDHVVAIGDGTNDVEFLKLAGLGIAMKNGHAILQEAADYTTEWTNDEEGVRKTLEYLQSRDQLKGPDTE
jgi:hydroxymethylpyrimidine pyrophosphatase-like HAD family hydrolase